MTKLQNGEVIESGWTKDEWSDFKDKLEKLTKEELFSLATVTGLVFEQSFDELEKKDFILALDEVSREELEAVYGLIVKNSRRHE